MTSEQNKEAYVWIWLPKRTTPVVCGKLEADGEAVRFNYGRSYLGRPDAIPVYNAELFWCRQFLNPFSMER